MTNLSWTVFLFMHPEQLIFWIVADLGYVLGLNLTASASRWLSKTSVFRAGLDAA